MWKGGGSDDEDACKPEDSGGEAVVMVAGAGPAAEPEEGPARGMAAIGERDRRDEEGVDEEGLDEEAMDEEGEPEVPCEEVEADDVAGEGV